MSAIVLKDVVKTFRHGRRYAQAVDQVSFTVPEQHIFGLIGPDGAGKTTLLRMVVSLLRPDSGELIVPERKLLGYMPQRFSLYPDLTVAQNLEFYGDLYGVSHSLQQDRLARLYAFSRLDKFHDRKAGALSGGMKQKLALICVLMHEPKILILDEPTVGVDPLSRHEFWTILHDLNKQGTTILVSTAYMDEAEQCHEVALMHLGRILTVADPINLCAQYQVDSLSKVFAHLQERTYA